MNQAQGATRALCQSLYAIECGVTLHSIQMEASLTATATQDVSFLYPHLFEVGQAVDDINANVTRMLNLLDRAIAMAEEHAPNLPELPLLRKRRQNLRRFQSAALNVSARLETELVALEDGYAKRVGLTV